jgi:hypothetical protein
VGVEDEVAMFKVREQVGLQELEVEYDAVAPLGRPEVEKESACDEPEMRDAVMTLLTDCPRVTVLFPASAREKLNPVGDGVLLGVVLHASGVKAELPAEL